MQTLDPYEASDPLAHRSPYRQRIRGPFSDRMARSTYVLNMQAPLTRRLPLLLPLPPHRGRIRTCFRRQA